MSFGVKSSTNPGPVARPLFGVAVFMVSGNLVTVIAQNGSPFRKPGNRDIRQWTLALNKGVILKPRYRRGQAVTRGPLTEHRAPWLCWVPVHR